MERVWARRFFGVIFNELANVCWADTAISFRALIRLSSYNIHIFTKTNWRLWSSISATNSLRSTNIRQSRDVDSSTRSRVQVCVALWHRTQCASASDAGLLGERVERTAPCSMPIKQTASAQMRTRSTPHTHTVQSTGNGNHGCCEKYFASEQIAQQPTHWTACVVSKRDRPKNPKNILGANATIVAIRSENPTFAEAEIDKVRAIHHYLYSFIRTENP